MGFVRSGDVRPYVEETGGGFPIVFVHKFASDHREWEPQLRWFSRSHRCVHSASPSTRPTSADNVD